jgi:hypothetical protein
MDVEKLLCALNNDNNEAIIDLDYATIAKEKNDILQRLNIPRERLKQMTKTLKSYRYVEQIEHIRYGSYIRWISLKNPDPALIKLTNGGLLCSIQAIGEDIHVLCKNNMNRLFQIKLSEVILFQKLNEQEQVILSALKYIQE